MTQDSGDDRVGYGKPPRHSQFQKGRSGNPRGRPRKAQGDGAELQTLLNAPVKIVKGGRTIMMAPTEIALRKMLSKAMAGGLKELAYLLDQFDRHGAFPAFETGGEVVVIPSDDIPFNMGVWLARFMGLPPWSRQDIATAKAHYLKHRSEDDKRLDDRMKFPALEIEGWCMTSPSDQKHQSERPSTHADIVRNLSTEIHKITADGKTKRLTTLLLLLHILNPLQLNGDVRVARLLDKYRNRFDDSNTSSMGLIVLPSMMSEERHHIACQFQNEWMEAYGPGGTKVR
ncbi:DUF5681 domain-containing protein [Zavarzinia sp.]|uniref:DUF5681 domain-containing protein n=1 Tax=Zavarzinia sp. TaxID=2027920 RepID=UPI0035619104